MGGRDVEGVSKSDVGRRRPEAQEGGLGRRVCDAGRRAINSIDALLLCIETMPKQFVAEPA